MLDLFYEAFAAIFHALLCGLVALVAASLSFSFGVRAVDHLPGEGRRPRCIYCSRPLKFIRFIPIFGWLLRKNFHLFPCVCGSKKMCWQQPFCEIAGFFLGVLAFCLQGWSIETIPLCIALGVLPAMSVIDFHFRIIPNSLNIIIGVCGLLFLLLVGEGMWLGIAVSAALLCVGLFLAVVYSSLRKREMLGLGDVKFFAAAGVWLDPFTASLFLGLGGIIGLIFNLLWRRISQDVQFPFGPALCISFVICIIYRLTG